jgi:hypothetical protein
MNMMLDDMRVETHSLMETKKRSETVLAMDKHQTISHLCRHPIKKSLSRESETEAAIRTSSLYKSTNSLASQVIVWVRINFENIGEVDTMNEKYQALVSIKCKWYHIDDNEDVYDYDPKKHWYPKLYIENALHDVKEEITYKVTKSENGRSLITETRMAKGSYWER